MMKPSNLFLFFILGWAPLSLLSAKPYDLDKRWSLEIPDEWWFSEAVDNGPLRVYTVGAASPQPLADSLVMLVDRTMSGSTPKFIRGISLAIAKVPVTEVVILGSEKFERKSTWLKQGYRATVKTSEGKLCLRVFVFTAQELPGAKLPDAKARLVMAHVAGRTEEEVEAFTCILEKISVSAWSDLLGPASAPPEAGGLVQPAGDLSAGAAGSFSGVEAAGSEGSSVTKERGSEEYRTEWNEKANNAAQPGGDQKVDKKVEIIEMSKPVYPPDMRRLGREATVRIKFVVDEDGTVASAMPVDINAQPLPFTASAMVAVWHWRFKPAMKSGRPVPTVMEVPVVFQLR